MHSKKQENFDSRITNDFFENENETDYDQLEECDYDNEPTDTREITSITKINQSHKKLLKSFRDKYPTSIRIPTDRILSSSSSFSSLVDNFENQDDYDNQFYNDYEGREEIEEVDYVDDDEIGGNLLSRNMDLHRRSKNSAKALSKSDLSRIYKELNEIHNKLVVSFVSIKTD